jgi:uncharacterized membrane protein YbhN (UPF0104 family)
VFCASWLGRYVPTSLPYFAGKVVMGSRLGHSRPALVASLVYENVLVLAIAAAVSCAALPLALSDASGPVWLALLGAAGAALLALLSPRVMSRAVAFGARVTRRPVPEGLVLSRGGLASAATFAAVVVVANGLSFAFVLGSFVQLDGREVVASAAVFGLAGVAGTLALPVPSGLGVREAVIVALVQLYTPVEVAAAAAVLSRVICLGVDVAFGLTGAAWFAYRRPWVQDAAEVLAVERAKAA